ncbi:MAG TPA: hypothetical protein QGF02_01635 [Candidatus Babeliales bacterium]|nr:hypothetical protein [Candidatus Babeliales bacterium]
MKKLLFLTISLLATTQVQPSVVGKLFTDFRTEIGQSTAKCGKGLYQATKGYDYKQLGINALEIAKRNPKNTTITSLYAAYVGHIALKVRSRKKAFDKRHPNHIYHFSYWREVINKSSIPAVLYGIAYGSAQAGKLITKHSSKYQVSGPTVFAGALTLWMVLQEEGNQNVFND